MTIHSMNYNQYADWLKGKLGLSHKSHLEDPCHKRYAIYFIRSHVQDFENRNKVSRTHLKIGKSDCIANMLRRREQAGSSTHIYGELLFNNKDEIDTVEKISKILFEQHKIRVNSTSNEIYNFNDNEILDAMKQLINKVHSDTSIMVQESIIFMNVTDQDLTVVPPKVETFNNLFEFNTTDDSDLKAA